MTRPYTDIELEAYLDEALTPSEMAEIEVALRDDAEKAKQLAAIIGRRDAGLHSVGEICAQIVSCVAPL